jgi:hypothetical protein
MSKGARSKREAETAPDIRPATDPSRRRVGAARPVLSCIEGLCRGEARRRILRDEFMLSEGEVGRTGEGV